MLGLFIVAFPFNAAEISRATHRWTARLSRVSDGQYRVSGLSHRVISPFYEWPLAHAASPTCPPHPPDQLPDRFQIIRDLFIQCILHVLKNDCPNKHAGNSVTG